ncbi:hypothetical protein [Blastococcus sp. CT_GayMR16]|uniref:hypothetical protein n=1 Tax=Blastococcus sp. CT_GayMR16 TaxID=2559607 RepID=UPI0010740DE7|nr:hypothetical protein [Blastococcus sp. CT_GayMR16]TFV90422.1 hypothetical protein E4P38_02995 [Blastococcus sp. CT_GayMR16]
MLNGMTQSGLITGYELRLVQTRHMSGTDSTTLRVPHAVLTGTTVDDLPARAMCGATVQQVGSKPWPPGQTMDSSSVPCGICEAFELVN